MNEEELKKGCGKEIEKNDKEVITCGNSLSYNGKLPNGRWKVFRFVLCSTCQARLEGFQKGKLEEKKEELEFLLNIQNWFDTATGQAYEVNNRIKQLQKEINSQTEQNSDKEVAQPYSKSDKTTKGFILSDEQFQKEVDFAKKEIGGMK